MTTAAKHWWGPAIVKNGEAMSKSLYSIIMLLALGLGLSGYAIYQILKGPDSDHIALGLFYLAAGVVAFVSLLRLPTKPAE